MAKVITLSRTFLAYHPKAGQPTYFVEQVLNALGGSIVGIDSFQYFEELNPTLSPEILDGFVRSLVSGMEGEKLHTIRAGHRWNQGDKASLRVWSGKPYNSPQIIIAPDVELVKVGDFKILKDIEDTPWMDIGSTYSYPAPFDLERSIIPTVAENDGLSTQDLLDWFQYPKPFDGQILCWKEVVYV